MSVECILFDVWMPNITYNNLCRKLIRREIRLTSVMSLRKEIENNCNETLQTIFSNHKYVGEASSSWSLFQHDTNLYICNTNKVL